MHHSPFLSDSFDLYVIPIDRSDGKAIELGPGLKVHDSCISLNNKSILLIRLVDFQAMIEDYLEESAIRFSSPAAAGMFLWVQG